MVEIGYGQCKQQITMMVKKLLDRTGSTNFFTNNQPLKDWWYAFLQRHPEVSLQTPQALQIYTYKTTACTPKVMDKWYNDYEQFLFVNDNNLEL